MTVTSLDYRNSYTADGVVTEFAYTFRVTESNPKDQIDVYFDGVLQSAFLYTITANTSGVGGVVTFSVAPLNNVVVLIQRDSDLLQEDALGSNSQNQALPPATIERMVDKLTIIMQQLSVKLGFALALPVTASPSINAALPDPPVAGAIPAWNATANAIQYVSPSAANAGMALISNGANAVPTYQPVTTAAGGNVAGPASSTLNGLPQFADTTGKILKQMTLPVAASIMLASSTLGAAFVPAWSFEPGHRLTTESGVPDSSTDRTAQGTIYFTKYKHNRLWLKWNGTWRPYAIDELSYTVAATNDTHNALYAYATSETTAAIEKEQWTNNTTRATAIAYDADTGLPIKSGDSTRLHIGDFYATASNQTEDSKARRRVTNVFNVIPRTTYGTDGTNTHTYGTNSHRPIRNQTTPGTSNRFDVTVSGRQNKLWARQQLTFESDGVGSWQFTVGIALDSTNSPLATAEATGGVGWSASLSVDWFWDDLAIGGHFVQGTEKAGGVAGAAGTQTIYNDNGGSFPLTYLRGFFWC